MINTLIQPGTPGFTYNVKIPATEPPGLYWYHPHVHGFTEFQVNGGAAGAIVVEGMEKVRPEVTGLQERIFVIRQQYLVPWIPGDFQLTVNYNTSPPPLVEGASSVIAGRSNFIKPKLSHTPMPEAPPPPPPIPVIQMQAGKQEFWRVANASLQDFLELQVIENNQPSPLQLIALDGYPLDKTRMQTTILIPPAGRAEFIVTPPAAGQTAKLYTQTYSTGPTGNPDLLQTLANIQLIPATPTASSMQTVQHEHETVVPRSELKFSNLANQTVTTARKLFFSEEFGGTNGPIQFYISLDGQTPKIFDPAEPPLITTKVGAVEDWTIENRALETHAFHIHQIHFQVLAIDGVPVTDGDLRDTIEIPYWEGTGPYHSVKVRMDFRDPTIAGTFLFHCHILLHEDLGMMHKILVQP